MRRFLIRCTVVFLLGLLLAACTASMSTQGPATWLDQPRDGAKLPLEPQEITAHASDEDGVASFDFYVDGTLLISVPMRGDAMQFGRPATSGATASGVSSGAAAYLADTTVGWNPSTPGVHTISARATDTQGNTGPEAMVVVTVGEVEVSPTPSPSVEPTEEIVIEGTPSPSSPVPAATPIEPTREPTSIPPTRQPTSIPPTRTPIPATATPRPQARRPEITYFEANPSTIDEGGCITLRWGVEYAAEVYLDGQGVGDHGTQQVCPPSTTSYSLFARSPGGEDTRSVTVTVRPRPTPTTKPPTPSPIVTYEIPDQLPPYVSNLSANPTSILASSTNCIGGKTTVSVFANDPSGVASVKAYWWLGLQNGESNMTPRGGGWYEAVLGPFDMIRTLQVWFVAWDTVGNSNEGSPVGPINVNVYDYCIG